MGYIIPDISMVKDYAEGYQNLYKPAKQKDIKLP